MKLPLKMVLMVIQQLFLDVLPALVADLSND